MTEGDDSDLPAASPERLHLTRPDVVAALQVDPARVTALPTSPVEEVSL